MEDGEKQEKGKERQGCLDPQVRLLRVRSVFVSQKLPVFERAGQKRRYYFERRQKEGGSVRAQEGLVATATALVLSFRCWMVLGHMCPGCHKCAWSFTVSEQTAALYVCPLCCLYKCLVGTEDAARASQPWPVRSDL